MRVCVCVYFTHIDGHAHARTTTKKIHVLDIVIMQPLTTGRRQKKFVLYTHNSTTVYKLLFTLDAHCYFFTYIFNFFLFSSRMCQYKMIPTSYQFQALVVLSMHICKMPYTSTIPFMCPFLIKLKFPCAITKKTHNQIRKLASQ